MERVIQHGLELIRGYHTQECRENILTKPIICNDDKAWLGVAYYFWTEFEFAKYWGEDFKSENTGFYDIYSAKLNTDNCINAVFNEEGYMFLRSKVEEALEYLVNSGIKVSLKGVHRFLSDEIWPQLGVTGIIYDDRPYNPKKKPNRVYSIIPDLYYKKRIQIALFNLKDVIDFEIHTSELEP